MAQNNPFDQFDNGDSAGMILRDPYKANAEARADRSADRQDAAALRAAEAAARAAASSQVTAAKTQQEIGDRDFSRGDKLRNDFLGLPAVKEYSAAVSALMSGLKAKSDGQGDNALIYAYAKAMDPGSVVRESEMGMASSTGSVIESTVASLKKQLGVEGGGQLSPQTRENLKREMNSKVAQLAKVYGVARSDFQRTAKQQGVNPEQVVGTSPAAGFVNEYKQIMGDRLKDQPAAVATDQAREIDPTGANSRLSPQDRDFISANARYMTPSGMKQWYADKGLSISDQEANDAYTYYQKGGRQDAAVNVPQGDASALGATAAGPIGAYFGGAFNGAIPGMTDELAGGIAALSGGNYAENRDKFDASKQAMANANPISSMLGNITGGTLALAAPGAALSKLGVGGVEATSLAPRLLAEDALYGTLYGAGENNADRVTGGLAGGLEGAAGGIIGRAGTRAAGMAFRGAKSAASEAPRLLREQGVPMTIPQMVGGRLKSYEDRLSGFQGIGNRIADQRKAGFDGFNKAAWKQVYEAAGEVPPGVIGEQGVDAFKAARSKLYGDALNGKSFDLNGDPAFAQDITAAWQMGSAIPDRMGKEFAHTVGLASSNLDNGIITGDGYQAALKRLRGDRSSFASDPRGGDFADAAQAVENAFTDAIGRVDPATGPALDRANRFYREGGILKDATGAARNTGLGTFTPAQLTNAAEKNARKFGGTESSTARPFFDLTRAAQEVLPSTIPDSGTAGRQSSGSFTGTLTDIAREAAYAPLYADPVKKAVAAGMFAKRPAQIERAGDLLVNKASYPAGSLGALLALQYGQ